METSIARMLPLVWAERPVTLVDVIADGSIPSVVKLHSDSKLSDPSGSSGGVSLQQPLLLYREAKTVRVVAKNVSSLASIGSKMEAKYKDGKSVIVIPMDYIGWFRVLDEETVPIVTISAVAREMPISFLSVKPLMGFCLLAKQASADKLYDRVQVPSGLFIVKSVMEDYVRYNFKTTQKKKLMICLVCVAEEGSEFLFPFEIEGDFYIVEGKKTNSKSSKSNTSAFAYQLKDLVTMGAFTTPLLLQLLIGDPPSKPCGFTGVLRVVDLIKDRTIVACLLDGSRKLLELPVMPFPKFTRALNGSDVLQTGSLKQELSYLSGAVDSYTKEIKVREVFAVDSKKKEK